MVLGRVRVSRQVAVQSGKSKSPHASPRRRGTGSRHRAAPRRVLAVVQQRYRHTAPKGSSTQVAPSSSREHADTVLAGTDAAHADAWLAMVYDTGRRRVLQERGEVSQSDEQLFVRFLALHQRLNRLSGATRLSTLPPSGALVRDDGVDCEGRSRRPAGTSGYGTRCHPLRVVGVNLLPAHEAKAWPQREHVCTVTLCSFMTVRAGLWYRSVRDRHLHRTSGTVHVCIESGAFHMCGVLCDRRVPPEHGEGERCGLTGVVLSLHTIEDVQYRSRETYSDDVSDPMLAVRAAGGDCDDGGGDDDGTVWGDDACASGDEDTLGGDAPESRYMNIDRYLDAAAPPPRRSSAVAAPALGTGAPKSDCARGTGAARAAAATTAAAAAAAAAAARLSTTREILQPVLFGRVKPERLLPTLKFLEEATVVETNFAAPVRNAWGRMAVHAHYNLPAYSNYVGTLFPSACRPSALEACARSVMRVWDVVQAGQRVGESSSKKTYASCVLGIVYMLAAGHSVVVNVRDDGTIVRERDRATESPGAWRAETVEFVPRHELLRDFPDISTLRQLHAPTQLQSPVGALKFIKQCYKSLVHRATRLTDLNVFKLVPQADSAASPSVRRAQP